MFPGLYLLRMQFAVGLDAVRTQWLQTVVSDADVAYLLGWMLHALQA